MTTQEQIQQLLDEENASRQNLSTQEKTLTDKLRERRQVADEITNRAVAGRYDATTDTGRAVDPTALRQAYDYLLGKAQETVQPVETQLSTVQKQQADSRSAALSALMNLLQLSSKEEAAAAEAKKKEEEKAKSDITLAATKEEIDPFVDKTAKSKIAETAAFLKDLNGIKNSLSATGLLGDKFTGQTGAIAQLAGQYGQSGALRTALTQLNANVKKNAYGSAVSEVEMKDAQKWLPQSNKQETENVKRIQSIIDSKTNQLTSILKAQGLNDDQISTYLDSFGLGTEKSTNQAENVTLSTGSKYQIEVE